MKKIIALICFVAGHYAQQSFAQSMNCATATSLNLSSGSACANGTNAGAITDNTLYGTCNASPVDVVWYTYVANGSNNNYTVTPGTLQNAEIIIYTGNCPGQAGAQLEYCTTASGSTPLVTTWGMVAGQQVWVGIASTTLQDGTFQLCVTSSAPAPGPGNTCAQAIPICTMPQNIASIPSNSSGLKPSCFGSAPQQDIFVQFTVTKAGLLAWTATCPATSEYDWALWDITSGCNGTLVCCNYNYASGSGIGFGMQNQTGTVTCNTSSLGSDQNEFCPAMNVTCGKTYAIQISNYSNNNTGFNLTFTNSTCLISSNANFTASPALVCGASLNATINNTSTGDCAAVWDYGDGSATYTGSNPPTHNYTSPGTYAITETIGGACPSTHTEFVQLLAPLAATVTATNTGCSGCSGTASVTAVSGGDGVYTYSWAPGGQTSTSLGSLCAGTYTATISNAKCGTSVTQVVTVNSAGSATIAVNSASICNGSSANLTANGCTSYTWSPATGLSSTSGSVVMANPSVTTTYTIVGANGACTATTTAIVTVTPAPSLTVSNGVICNGGSATLTANGATSYTWSPGTGLSATTGSAVTANPASTTVYTITGANGTCTATATSTVTVVSNPTVTVSSGTICVGQQTTTLTANGASTYVWNPGTGLSATTGSVVTANPGATQVYTVTGTVGTCTAVGTGTVTVVPLPTVTSTSGTICVGQGTATLTASGATSYTWSPGTGLSSTTGTTVTANPGSTTNYTVTGADANGCTNTGTATVVVNSLPNVTVNSGLICSGGSMTLNANGASTYTWSPATGLSSTNGASVNANPGSTSTYTVIGTDINGCVNQNTSTVTVVSNPTITATTGTICVGQGTATLTASGGSTYTWSPAASLSASTGSVVTATPAATQVYTITGTVGTCTAIGTTTVTVNPLPNITAGSNSPVCVNGNLNLNAGNGVNYTWNGPNSFSSMNQNPSITGVTAAAAGVYTVTANDLNGCVNSQTTNVIINPLPIVTATGATVCLGQTATLGSLPNNATAYSWGGPGGYTSAAQNPSIANVSQSNAGSYIVTVTDNNGCVNAAVANIAVNSLPTISASSGTICAGQTTATITASGANTYAWSPGTGLSSTTGSAVVAGPASTSTYTVTGTDLNGCQNTATVNVFVNPAPTLSVVPQRASGCAPLCVTFTNSTSATGTCSWTFGDGANDATCNPSHCFNAQGSYNVTLTLTDGNGCKNSNTATVTVYPVPDADFNMNPQPTTILEPTIQFYDASSGAIISNWAWNFGDYGSSSNTSTIQTPSHVYSDTGAYAVQLLVISDHGCRDSVIKMIRIDDDYAMYVPNAFSPNSDGTNDVFKAIGFGVKTFRMYIFDRWGNQVFFSDDIEVGWDGRYRSKGEEIVQQDVYVWKIEARTVRNEKKTLSGVVTLLK